MRIRYILMLALVLCLLPYAAQIATAQGGTLHRSLPFTYDGVERRYHFYEAQATDGARPLVLLLHGGGADIDNHIGLGFVDWPHQVWLDIAEEEDLYVVVPQGLNRQWNDCRADCERCGDADDSGFLLALLDEIAENHVVDPERIYVVGESNGGFMTQRLAQESPERFAAMGVVISLMPANNECEPQNMPISIMYQVGTNDEFVLYDGGSSAHDVRVLSAIESVDYWRGINHCDAEPVITSFADTDPQDNTTVTQADYDCPSTNTMVSLVTMNGAGHVPPSIEVHTSAMWEGFVGAQNHDIEGARVFWAFFQTVTPSP